jgi:hypothetical protein
MPEVTVAWCGPDAVHEVSVRVHVGVTVAEAIRASGIGDRFPEAARAAHGVGIFNRLCDPGTPVRDGDRIEIYRPLVADPKTARRRRAARQQ